MTEGAIPARQPATGMDVAALLLRSVLVHLELGCRLVLPAHLDADRVERAVRLSLDAEPVLGCGLEARFFGATWRRLETLDARTAFTLKQTDDADAQWREFVRGTIDDAGPQVAVALIRTGDHDEIFIRISHVASDGHAVKSYAYLLAALYSELMRSPDYQPAPNLMPRPCIGDALATFGHDELLAAPKEPARPKREFWEIPPKSLTGQQRSVRQRDLDPQTFGAIRRYGRTRGASVNDVVLTALLRAMANGYSTPENAPMALDFSADYRRYLDSERADRVANVSSSVSLGVRYVEGEEFETTLARVCEQTAAVREALWGLRGAAKLEAMCGRSLKPLSLLMGSVGRRNAKRGLANAYLSNFGVLDESRLSFDGIAPTRAFIIGPAPWGSGQLTAASTYRDTVTLSAGFCANDQDANAVEGALQRIVDELEGCARTQTSADHPLRPGGDLQ